MKKVLSAVMSVAMVASFASTAALAERGDEIHKDSWKYAADSGIGSSYEIATIDSLDYARSLLMDDDGSRDGVYWDTTGWTIEPDQDVYLPLSAFIFDPSGANDTTDLTSFLPIVGTNPIAGSEHILPSLMDDAEQWKLKVKKNSGSKMLSGVTLVDKNFGTGRHAYIKISVNDNYTTDDNKIDLDLTITNNSKRYWQIGEDAASENSVLKSSDGLKLKLVFWVKNREIDADADYAAGDKGSVLNPSKNDDNEILWSDENNDIARLTFSGDSDVVKFFPKLSTVWDNNDYAAFFNDQDAFFFDFVANPYISTTSRALLEIYNPYIDEDGNATADPESVVIYQVVDGELIDVTSNFAFTDNDDGDEVFQTKTRQLGTYIFAEKAVQQAAPEPVAPAEPEAPAVDDGDKVIPNTGAWA